MAKYSDLTIENVKKNADIRLFIPGADTTKSKQYIDCPFCGEKKKFGITHNLRNNSASCFKCKQGFSNAVAAWMHFQGYDKKQFPKAVEEVAKSAGIFIQSVDEEKAGVIRSAADSLKESFCESQLKASGLTVSDVMAVTSIGNQKAMSCPFQSGSFGTNFTVDPLGMDMVIRYYDLHGRQMTYSAKGTSTPRAYVRVRFQNPDLHMVKDKPMKYQTPAGAPCRAYIPQYIRSRFQKKEHIETLFLQEGEKKAEKACKHGMPSIGIQGISNIGTSSTGLLQDIQDVIQTCGVRNVVLMMDSDWDDLHRNITVGDSVAKRPNSFAGAVVKFKQYIASLRNINLDVEAWWGHVNQNDFCDKGVDDLLCNTLKSRENELMHDADIAMNSVNGSGQFVSIVKVSTLTDFKIRDIWALNDHQEFFNRHFSRLSTVSSFRLGGVRYKVEDGKMSAVSSYSSEEEIYAVTENDKGAKKVALKYMETMRFLGDSGFKIMLESDPDSSSFDFIHIDDGIVTRTSPFKIRDFVRRFVDSTVKDPLVIEYFYSKLDVVLADKKLEGLPIIYDEFSNIEPLVQRTYYNNGQVEITPENITPGLAINNVWRSRIVPRDFNRVPIIADISKVGDRFNVKLTPEAKKCEFLQYLINTSNNFFPYNAPREVTEDEKSEWTQQLVNKITSIGYLLAEWKPSTERKVVVVQDHQMSEVGQSNGGAGKSLVGNALAKIIPQIPITGSTFKKDDPFVFSAVTKVTRNLFIDDIRPNFDFKHIYPMVTADMEVNPKGRDRFYIPVDKSPKMLITTNHTINGSMEGSTRRRIIYMEYSNWYNPEHTPFHDFKHMLFDDWDEEQWTLFDNLMAECVMFYFRSFEKSWHDEGCGAVPPPMRQIELRSLRQEMSESFLQWAEEYYDPSGPHLCERELRSDVFASFVEFAGSSGHGVSRSNIFKRIQKFCRFKGYDLNINKPNDRGKYYLDFKKENPNEIFIGGNDKSGGKEYFTVYSDEKSPSDSSTRPL